MQVSGQLSLSLWQELGHLLNVNTNEHDIAELRFGLANMPPIHTKLHRQSKLVLLLRNLIPNDS